VCFNVSHIAWLSLSVYLPDESMDILNVGEGLEDDGIHFVYKL